MLPAAPISEGAVGKLRVAHGRYPEGGPVAVAWTHGGVRQVRGTGTCLSSGVHFGGLCGIMGSLGADHFAPPTWPTLLRLAAT